MDAMIDSPHLDYAVIPDLPWAAKREVSYRSTTRSTNAPHRHVVPPSSAITTPTPPISTLPSNARIGMVQWSVRQPVPTRHPRGCPARKAMASCDGVSSPFMPPSSFALRNVPSPRSSSRSRRERRARTIRACFPSTWHSAMDAMRKPSILFSWRIPRVSMFKIARGVLPWYWHSIRLMPIVNCTFVLSRGDPRTMPLQMLPRMALAVHR
mmetsp:Transcript_5955/g.13540  ORF Transcript_5955/g.13540 Transcript_5955/m.13540 type:complete len:210 (+) Transcript_5955:340-969(+)